MTESSTSHPTKHNCKSAAAAAPEYKWISKGSTLNPAPGPLLMRHQDTAEGCRDRASADLLEAVTMATEHSRQMLERSSASWSKRAEMLQRVELSIHNRLEAVELTKDEIAEDVGHTRL